MTEHPDDVSALIERIPLAHYVWCGMQEGTHEAQCDCGFPERMEVVETLERLAAENKRLQDCESEVVTMQAGLIDQYRRDAERYRWLRDQVWSPTIARVVTQHRNAEWDATIDAAMAKERE